MTRYYHRTTEDSARSILRNGFRASETNGWLDENGAIIPGVWLSDVPVPDAFGSALLVVELPDDLSLELYEDFDGPTHRRVWYVPLDLVNELGQVTEQGVRA